MFLLGKITHLSSKAPTGLFVLLSTSCQTHRHSHGWLAGVYGCCSVGNDDDDDDDDVIDDYCDEDDNDNVDDDRFYGSLWLRYDGDY